MSQDLWRALDLLQLPRPSPEELGMQIEVPETGEVQQDSRVMVPAEAQAELDARVRDEEKDSEAGPVMVDGVTLNLECTLSTLCCYISWPGEIRWQGYCSEKNQ